MSETNVQIVRAISDAFNRGGVEAILDFFDPEFEGVGLSR